MVLEGRGYLLIFPASTSTWMCFLDEVWRWDGERSIIQHVCEISEILGSMRLINLRALDYSNASAVRVLLRAQGFINAIGPFGRGI